MLIIHPLKIAYQETPKVGSTSLVDWLYKLLSELGHTPVIKNVHKRTWLETRQRGIIGKQSLDNFKCPEGYFTFCLVRDPVERIVSVYNNRIMHHKKLGLPRRETQNAMNTGLAVRPTINYFINNLEKYQSAVPDIRWHSLPQSHFLGQDITIYNKVFKLDEMDSLRLALIEHWQNNNLAIAHKNIPPIPQLQNQYGKKKHTTADLNYQALQKCLRLYNIDYNNFPILDKRKTERKWQKAHGFIENNHTNAMSRSTAGVTIKSKKADSVELANIFEIKAKIKDGLIESLSGIILLKPSVKHKYKIVAQDALTIHYLQWKLPSSNMPVKYPNNPYASNARFKAQNLQINSHHPVRIFLEDRSGKRHLLFVIAIN